MATIARIHLLKARTSAQPGTVTMYCGRSGWAEDKSRPEALTEDGDLFEFTSLAARVTCHNCRKAGIGPNRAP